MNILNKLHALFGHNAEILPEQEPSKEKCGAQPLYRYHDFTAVEVNELFADMLRPAQSFVGGVSVRLLPNEQLLSTRIQLKSFLRPLSFACKARLVDIWHDNWTSTAVFEQTDMQIHLISLLPKTLQQWCGEKIIDLISFLGSMFQSEEKQKARFYLQGQMIYIDFRPWLQNYLEKNSPDPDDSAWLNQLFGNDRQRTKGRRYIKNHIVFGSEILGDLPFLRLYIYRMPAAVYKNTELEIQQASAAGKFALLGNWLEWMFAVLTSFLLVSFLVPFGMAYMNLQPINFDNLFSLPFIFLYNTFLVLIPLIIFRIVLMPMRRVWASRHGDIEILQAEVARDQVFLPLLREWIIALQTREIGSIPAALLDKIRSLLVKIGIQKYLLVDKIGLIERRRRMYARIIIVSYLGVCLLEALFLTKMLPTPYFFVNKINHLLSWMLLSK